MPSNKYSVGTHLRCNLTTETKEHHENYGQHVAQSRR